MNFKYIFRFFSFFILCIFLSGFSLKENEVRKTLEGDVFTPPSDYSTSWVDSVLANLTLEEKIGQLFMIEVNTSFTSRSLKKLEKQILDKNLGGIIFFDGGPVSQLNFTNQIQKKAKVPLMIAMDAEWGLSMRLDSTPTFPRQITLGAISNDRLIYHLGMEMGWQCKRLGINMNFSPVADVNSNPSNPVINSRSFGEDRYNVARKSLALMMGMNDTGVLACAKHFPGHGDTETDSHHALPMLNHTKEEIDSIHIFPFQKLIDNGLKSVMNAHLNIPALDNTPNIPSSLSSHIIDQKLKKEMGFKGLVITDAMNMKGVTEFYDPGQLELEALRAGNDIILMPRDVDLSVKTIKKAVEDNTISEKFINQKVRKVLYFKELAELDNFNQLTTYNIHQHLNAPRVDKLNRKLAEASITIIKNDQNTLPLKRTDTLDMAVLSIGSSVDNPFQAMLSNYYPFKKYSIYKNHTVSQAAGIIEEMEKYNLIIVSVHNNSMFPGRNYGINNKTIELINTLSRRNNVILNIFANPYSLKSFGDNILNNQAILVSYQDGRDFEEASAEVIFGVNGARGRLPVSVVPHFPIYTGIRTDGDLRIKYRDPEEMGVNSTLLQRVDSLAMEGIAEEAYPGCQIAVIKDNAMIYHKSFGHHTYDAKKAVKNDDIYDLASLTKILATTATMMKLSSDGLIDIDNTLGDYLPMVRGSNKEDIWLRELMAHQARLRSWLPFYLMTILDGKSNPDIIQPFPSDQFPVQVAENFYINKDYRDTIFKHLIESDLLRRKRYIYSDLGFIMLAGLIEEVTGKSIDTYVEQEFYSPLGLQNICYLPRNHHDESIIVPTENDTLFRFQKVHGYVHDPAAAMLGGVSGHAGLFSNSHDVAIIMQMFLEGGTYGGTRYLKPDVIDEFTRTQFAGNKNRRALGFDKPNIQKTDMRSACESASPLSFGHSGFTGTYAWADPAENLVYVFLSNRVYPDASNRKISQMDIRTNIHQAIYDAVFYYKFVDQNRIP